MHVPWEDLELFLAVAEEKSFSAAARRLGLTQPTVSRRIHALEQRTRCELFVRDAEGARLSEDGIKLMPATVQMARLAQQAGGALHNEEEASGTVCLGAEDGVCGEVLYFVARELRKGLPSVSVHGRFHATESLLQRGDIDFWICRRPTVDQQQRTVCRLELKRSVFAAKSYARRLERRQGRQRCSTTDLDWVFSGAKVAVRDLGRNPVEGRKRARRDRDAAFTTDEFEQQVRAAEMGLGAMIVPQLAVLSAPHTPLVEVEVDFEVPAVMVSVFTRSALEHVGEVRAVERQLLDLMRAAPGVVVHTE